MSNVIAAGNIQLGMNANGLYAEAKRVQAQMRELKSVVRQTADPKVDLARKQALLAQAFHQGAFTAQDYARRLDVLNAKFKATSSNASSAHKDVRSFNDTLKSFALAGAVGGAAGVGFLSAKAIGAASRTEAAKADFKAMIGDAERAQQLLENLRNLANQTPLSFQGASNSARLMLASRIEIEKVMPTLWRLSEISGGNDEKLWALSYAFSQVAQMGRLAGQELNQFINAGYNPLATMARETGIEMSSLLKMKEDGLISLQMIEAAIAVDGAGGARLKEAQGTLIGQWAEVSSKIDEIYLKLGNQMLPAVKEIVTASKDFFDSTGFDHVLEGVKWIAKNRHLIFYENPSVRRKKQEKEVTNRFWEEAKAEMERRNAMDAKNTSSNKNEQSSNLQLLMRESIEKASAAESAKKELERQKEIVQQLQKQSDIRKRMMESGREIMERYNPALKMRNEIRELLNLRQIGAIDQNTFLKAGTDAVRQARGGTSQGLAQSINAGSQEAYRLLVSKKSDKQEERLTEIKELTRISNDIQRETITAIQRIPGMEVYR